MTGKSKRIELTLFLMFFALFLATILVLLLWKARDIQRVMLTELETASLEAAEEFLKVHLSIPEDSEDTLYLYQTAMVDNDDGLRGSYPVQCVSCLTAREGYEKDLLVRSRNCLMVEVTWRDGTEQKIPMVFELENTADVAAFLCNTRYQIPYVVGDSVLNIAGWWQDGLFYIQNVTVTRYNDVLYESPRDLPEGAEAECLTIYTHDIGSTKSFLATATLKSYGSDSYQAAFRDLWMEADDLLELARETPLPDADGMIKQRSLTETVVHRYISLYSVGQFREQGYPILYYHYLARFSPLELAAGEIFGGVFWILLIAFGLAGFFLYTTYYYVRNREQRALRDEINRQKQALEYAQGAERSRREMTSAIAHELKTPIAVLSSYAEALQENIDRDKQAHYLSVIRVETAKMDRMVLELLDLSRLEAGKYKLRREQFDLLELTKEILLPLQEEIDAKHLTVEYQVTNSTVEADRYRIGQVLENFMTNAIRHTPEGGKIVIRMGDDAFSVENQGSRIPEDNLRKVWETFWQGDASRNERGSGLGLAICRSIVQLHGGTCKAENTSAGVRFSVSLTERKKLYQLGSFPREQVVELDYPIAQQFTRAEQVFDKLGLMSRGAVRRETRAGNIRLGTEPLVDVKTKLFPGYVLSWEEFRITIRRDETEKARALLMERMRPGGLGNPNSPTGWGGWIKR